MTCSAPGPQPMQLHAALELAAMNSTCSQSRSLLASSADTQQQQHSMTTDWRHQYAGNDHGSRIGNGLHSQQPFLRVDDPANIARLTMASRHHQHDASLRSALARSSFAYVPSTADMNPSVFLGPRGTRVLPNFSSEHPLLMNRNLAPYQNQSTLLHGISHLRAMNQALQGEVGNQRERNYLLDHELYGIQQQQEQQWQNSHPQNVIQDAIDILRRAP